MLFLIWNGNQNFMHPTQCLNCGQVLQPDQNFCPRCGQKTDTHRLTIPHFIHEFFHAFTHADKGLFHLLKELATKPGMVAREYVVGKRKSYFNPFNFFLIMMGLFVFLNLYFKPPVKKNEPNPYVLARIPTEAGKQKYIAMMHRVGQATGFFSKHGNIVAMVAVPFISLLTWLFFYKRKFNYAEHLTANLMFITFANMVFAIIVFPLQSVFKGEEFSHYFTYAALLLQVIYLTWCLNGFLELRTIGERTKSALVNLLALFLWFVFSLSLMALYIYQNKNFYEFFLRMFKR